MSEPLLTVEALVAGWVAPTTPPISIVVGAGEIVGLTGPNGVGKSTLLAALAGRARVFAGRFDLAAESHPVWQTQEIPPVIGLPLSGRDLLTLTSARPEGLPEWLIDKLDLRLDRLSGGQRHYLALWAVLQHEGRLVLLDEPTNNLDVAGTTHLTQALRVRANDGAGLLVVSHDDDFINRTCDRTIDFSEFTS